MIAASHSKNVKTTFFIIIWAAEGAVWGIIMDIEEASKHFIHVYNRNKIFAKGENVYLYDTEGNKYLDMGAGIAVSALGYSNEEYKQGLKDQIDKIIHPYPQNT